MPPKRKARASGAPSRALELLGLPSELLAAIAQHVDCRTLMQLGETCRQLRELSLLPQLNTQLELDFSTDRWIQPCSMRSRALHHSLRLWARRRRTSLRALAVELPGGPHEPFDTVQQRLLPLLGALVATLEEGLHRLQYRFTCYSPWSDALLPVGGGLRELRLADCHLPAMPQALAGLTALTRLDLSLCEGFAEAQEGLPNLSAVLGRLTGLQHLVLKSALFGGAPSALSALTGLTYLDLSANYLGGDAPEPLPEGCSTLGRLQELTISDCGLTEVPPVIQHFTELRALTLTWNALATVPRELSTLSKLERLVLNHNNSLTAMPEAFTGLTSLKTLFLGHCLVLRDLPPGPYMSNLEELDLSYHLLGVRPAAPLAALSQASRLRRLSLSAAFASAELELPAPVRGLQGLTSLDLSGAGFVRFPEGPWAARLEELSMDRLPYRSKVTPGALPPLPALRRLSWCSNRKLPLGAARDLVQRAPALRRLVVDYEGDALTRPALKELEAAGVQVGSPRDGGEQAEAGQG